MRVAITGATGFVGRHLLHYLKSRGLEVVPFSRSESIINGVRCCLIDYSVPAGLLAQLSGIDAVVHLGGLAHKLDGKHSLDEYRRANVDSTLVLAQAAQVARVHRFIYISSIAVNGGHTDGRKPFSEEDFPMPVTLYGQSKLMAEEGIHDIFKGSLTDFVIFRPPLIYGEDCPGNFRELLRLISSTRFLPFGALSCKKSMISVHNFVDAIFHALGSPEARNQTFIVSDLESLPLNKLIDILMTEFYSSKAINFSFPPNILAVLLKIVGKQKQWLKFTSPLEVNSEKFCNMTNWTVPYTVREGLRVCVKGFLRNA